MLASVLPLYSQEIKTAKQMQSVRSTSEQISEDFVRKNADSGEAEDSQQAESRQRGANKSPDHGYAFPTKRERFNRYVSSTVGPSSLLRRGLSAGIGQWRDHPTEWGQGASGFGKRYATAIKMD
jgi:hypothetical protein